MAKTKVSLTADQITSKWQRNMTNAVTDIVNGINAVTESPMEKAIAKKDKMVENFVKAANNGRLEAGLRSVSLTEWKTKTAQKTQERLAGGVQAATAKHRKFSTYLVETLNGVLPTVAEMPDMTIEDSLNRVRAVITHMHNNPYKG